MVVAEIYAVVAVSAPSYAFQVASTTGYARYVTQAAQQAYVAAHRAQVISTLAPTMSAAGVGSVAFRMVAGPIGWASLGVTAGLVIAGMLYTNTEIQSVKNNAATAAGIQPVITINGQTYNGTLSSGCGTTPTIGCLQTLLQLNGMPVSQCASIPVPMSANPPAGWTAQPVQWMQPNGQSAACYSSYTITYNGTNGANLATSQPGTPSTQHVQDYLSNLSSSDALAPEKQTDSAGTTNPAQSGSSSTTDQPVSPGDMPTQVGPASSVPTGAAVVDPNAPPTTTQTQTQQQTSTTTTTTNADGSQTDTTTASISCSQGSHNSKTFGQVLQDHYNLWSASGLLGTLELLKNLSWPTTFPTYTLHSTVMGTFTFDFNAWSGVINALRALVIAGAGFVAYRIIFVGGH
ncbi:MAG: protein of unknown function [Nitrospira sp.]